MAALQAYSLGQLDAQRSAEVEAYLAEHPEYLAVLDAAPDDEVVRHLRGAGNVSAGDASSMATTAHYEEVSTPVPADGTPESESAPPDIPEALARHPRYRLLRKLGEGGMGTVFLAEHRVMRRSVALKVIRPHCLAHPQAVARFRREVQAAAGLSHANVVTAHDADEANGLHFLVMEYVEGVSLDRYLAERGPLPVAEACACARQAALALQYAHERGMVHRDVKPHNLMRLPDGTVKVLDFGLARLASEPDDSGPVTALGTVMGTADYMAPEQGQDSRNADIRADIYSLGCVLYQLLTGRLPFPDGTTFSKIMKHTLEQPRPVAELRPDLPAALVPVVETMMARHAVDRYQTPAAVAAALEPFTRQGEKQKAEGRRQKAEGGRPFRRLAAYCLLPTAFCLLAAAVVYRIQTDRGELVIETESDDVEVVVKQGGRVVRILDTKTTKAITLKSGAYELELKHGKGLKLDVERVTLTRGSQVLARIERRPAPEGRKGPPKRLVAEPPNKPALLRPVAPKVLKVARCFSWPGRGGFSTAFSGDSRLCAGFGGDAIRVWEVETGKMVREIAGLPSTVTVRFVPGDKELLSSHTDGTFRRWELATGKKMGQLYGPPEWNLIGGITPDRASFCFFTVGGVRVWELSTGTERFRIKPTGAKAGILASHALSPDGKRLLVADYIGPGRRTLLRVFDVATGKETRSITPRLIYPDNVAWGADSRRIYLNASEEGTHLIASWDADTGEMLSRGPLVPNLASSQGRFFSRDTRFFGVQYPDKHLLHLYEMRSGRLVGTARAPVAGFSLSFSPDGRYAACGSRGEAILYRLEGLVEPSRP